MATLDESRSIMAVLISDTSEEFWAAGWLNDCEYSLWALVQQYRRTGKCSAWGGANWEHATSAVKMLSEASLKTNEWARWEDDGEYPGAVPVSIEEWESVWWPQAPEQYRDLAAADPTCGEFGPMVPYENLNFSYFSSCRKPAGHDDEHVFVDGQGNVVTDDEDAAPTGRTDSPTPPPQPSHVAEWIGVTNLDEALPDSVAAYVWIDPARLSGEPCIGGTRLQVAAIGDLYRWLGMDAVMEDYNLTRAQVLVACWYLGAYGNGTLHARKKEAKRTGSRYAQAPDRNWWKWWGEWAEDVAAAMHRHDYDAVPNPPRKAKWSL